jgi:hypothetical protein
MAEESTGAMVQHKLTETGLVRALSRQDISPELVRILSVDQAARLLQRGMLYPGPTPKTAKKSKKGKNGQEGQKSSFRCSSKSWQYRCASNPTKLLETG